MQRISYPESVVKKFTVQAPSLKSQPLEESQNGIQNPRAQLKVH
jgi:hypothetical protein